MNKQFKGLLNSKIKERLRKSAGLRKSTNKEFRDQQYRNAIATPMKLEFVDKEYRKETVVLVEFKTLSETHLRELGSG